MALNIFVQGEEYPLPVWADQQEGASETITSSDEGFFTGIKIWQNISSIIVRGLPAGVRLRCWQMPFNLPAVRTPRGLIPIRSSGMFSLTGTGSSRQARTCSKSCI